MNLNFSCFTYIKSRFFCHNFSSSHVFFKAMWGRVKHYINERRTSVMKFLTGKKYVYRLNLQRINLLSFIFKSEIGWHREVWLYVRIRFTSIPTTPFFFDFFLSWSSTSFFWRSSRLFNRNFSAFSPLLRRVFFGLRWPTTFLGQRDLGVFFGLSWSTTAFGRDFFQRLRNFIFLFIIDAIELRLSLLLEAGLQDFRPLAWRVLRVFCLLVVSRGDGGEPNKWKIIFFSSYFWIANSNFPLKTM